MIDPILPDQPEKFRSFTVRVPQSLYLRMSTLAQNENLHLNKKVNQLLLLGLGENIKVDDILMRLIKQSLPKEPTDNV